MTDAPEWTAVLAAEQTAGRGRLGRSFHSPAGVGMYLSVAIDVKGGLLEWLTPAAAVAARRVAAEYGVASGIKWVNDLVCERGGVRRKLCGILVELRGGRAIVGVGLNLAHGEGDFPEELRGVSTSLALEGGAVPTAVEAAQSFLAQFRAVLEGGEQECFDEYAAACVTPGKSVEVRRTSSGAPVPARALALERDYAMLVEFEDGRRESLRAGEASVSLGRIAE